MINSLELFCGAGGLALGLQQAGFRHKFLIEIDKKSCGNISANIDNGYEYIKGWNVLQSDVRDINFKNLCSGSINMISGGPPCQPFSLGGKHLAEKDDRDMFPQAVRAVRELAPEAFIFENVKGLLRKSFASYFNYILLQLSYPEIEASENKNWLEHLNILEKYNASKLKFNTGLSYNVVFKLVNAADYGVPQIRHRVIIVGFRNDINVDWSFPAPTHSQEALFESKWVTGEYWQEHDINNFDFNAKSINKQLIFKTCAANNLKRWRTVRDALKGLDNLKNVKNHEYRKGAKIYQGHSGSLLDEPSKTIKAGSHGVPGGENMLILDNGTTRYYTVRESARLQTFPDDYIFCGSWTDNMRQIGNAVPVELARIIGKSVFNKLNQII